MTGPGSAQGFLSLWWRLGLTAAWLASGSAFLALAVASRQVNTSDLGRLSWLAPFTTTVIAAGFSLANGRRALFVSTLATLSLAAFALVSFVAERFVGTLYLMGLAGGAALFTAAVYLGGRLGRPGT